MLAILLPLIALLVGGVACGAESEQVSRSSADTPSPGGAPTGPDPRAIQSSVELEWFRSESMHDIRVVHVSGDRVYWVSVDTSGGSVDVDGDPNAAEELRGWQLQVEDLLGVLDFEVGVSPEDAERPLRDIFYYSTGERLRERRSNETSFESWGFMPFIGDFLSTYPYVFATDDCSNLERTSIFYESRGDTFPFRYVWNIEAGAEPPCRNDKSCFRGSLWWDEQGGLCAGKRAIRSFDVALQNVQLVVETEREPVAMCAFGDSIYWLEGHQKRPGQGSGLGEAEVTLHHSDREGRNTWQIPGGPPGFVGAFHCDAVAHQLFWVHNRSPFTDPPYLASIQRFDAEALEVTPLVESNVAISGLGVHERYVFWSEQKIVKRLER